MSAATRSNRRPVLSYARPGTVHQGLTYRTPRTLLGMNYLAGIISVAVICAVWSIAQIGSGMFDEKPYQIAGLLAASVLTASISTLGLVRWIKATQSKAAKPPRVPVVATVMRRRGWTNRNG